MSGTGNDFLLIDNREGVLPEGEVYGFARQVCPRATAVGADGIVLIENSNIADFKMRIINADGSEAEMCGNGSRCTVAFALENNIASTPMTFETLAGIIKGEVKNNVPVVGLGECVLPETFFDFKISNIKKNIYFLNTGVPHAVVPVDNIENIEINSIGREIRFHDKFSPKGTNVNFIQKAGNGIRIRTYERGVEAETLACGTGATASAIVASQIWGLESPVEVGVQSGEFLNIHFNILPDKVTDILLEGKVNFIYEGSIYNSFYSALK
jgi:diaminopimelate epimerase